MEMTPRKEKILASVVTGFVKSGEPVGSKAIADEIGVSSATVRNEMAELIELGFLEQPHTSAGRVPSQKGYREYVDRLMETPPLGEEEKRYLDSMLLTSAYDPERLLRGVSKVLAAVTRYAAVVTTPSGASAKIKAVQFVQTSRRTAMLILLNSAGAMQSRVFHCDFDLTSELVRMFFRVFNEKLAGKDVSEVTPALLQSMAVSLGQMYVLVGAPLRALLEAARDAMQTDLYLNGQMNLLFYPELELGGARRVMDFLERREDVVSLLRCKPGCVTVLIGRESGRPELSDSAVAVSRYQVNGQDAGAIAAIGPVRMDYAKLTVILRYLSDETGNMLTMLMREE